MLATLYILVGPILLLARYIYKYQRSFDLLVNIVIDVVNAIVVVVVIVIVIKLSTKKALNSDLL